MTRIPRKRKIDDFILGDDGEEMESEDTFGIQGCGTKYYRHGCGCPDCSDRGDWEYHAKRDRELEDQ